MRRMSVYNRKLNLVFASVGLLKNIPGKPVVKKNFSCHNIDLRLLYQQGLLFQYQACLLSNRTYEWFNNCFEKQIEKIFLSLDLPATDATYQHFCNAIRKAAEKLSQKIITKTIVRVGMQSVKASTHVPAFSREISRVLLQRIYSQDLTENGGIDGLKQFRESTFYTLAFPIGRITHGLRNTVTIHPGSMTLFPRPVSGPLEWACSEQFGLSAIACGLVFGAFICP